MKKYTKTIIIALLLLITPLFCYFTFQFLKTTFSENAAYLGLASILACIAAIGIKLDTESEGR